MTRIRVLYRNNCQDLFNSQRFEALFNHVVRGNVFNEYNKETIILFFVALFSVESKIKKKSLNQT